MGFICHYGLDSSIHSYVFPKEKTIKEQNPDYDEAKQGRLHGRIESGIEWLIYQCRRKPGETMGSIMEPYQINDCLMRRLEDLYASIARTVYGMDAGLEPFSLSFDSAFRCFQKLPAASDVFVEDILNLNRKKWEIFDTPGKYLKKSVFELYEIGLRKSVNMIVQLYWYQNSPEKFQPAVTRNFSYWRFEHFAWMREYYHI